MRTRQLFSDMLIDLPHYSDAPLALLRLEGHCGLISTWIVLKYFHRKTSSDRIVTECKYSKKHGCFAIAIAAALRLHGLRVEFYTDVDLHPHKRELEAYGAARKLGVKIRSALSLNEVLERCSKDCVPILSFDTTEGFGHFSPLVGERNGKLILSYCLDEEISFTDFEKRWSKPEILRQCILAMSPERKIVGERKGAKKKGGAKRKEQRVESRGDAVD